MTIMDQPANQYLSPWDQIRYAVPVPQDFLVPEHHWPAFQNADLSDEQRIRLNHLACVFMCEMFVHFERYIIDYVAKYETKLCQFIPRAKLDRFVAEEVDHTEAFYRLLELLEPETYPNRELRFLRWSAWDRMFIRFLPVPGFFMMAALFEEMTLFVPVVMEENAEQSFQPILDVMVLHAKEERSHIGIDLRILQACRERRPRWLYAIQTLMALPVTVFIDRVLARRWRKAARAYGRAEGLNRKQIRKIANRGASASDLLGIYSFIEKQSKNPVPGGRTFCALLKAFTP